MLYSHQSDMDLLLEEPNLFFCQDTLYISRYWSLHNSSLSSRSGLIDNFGAEAMMMEALDKVEKEIKKPLLRSDKKCMALLHAEFDKINKK